MGYTKEPVKLRQRLLKSGNTTLYLDIYIKGKRTCESLGLFLIPEHTRADKAANRETLRLAEAIKAQRVVEVQNGRFGFDDNSKLGINFLDYFIAMRDKYPKNSASWFGYTSAHIQLCKYCSRSTTFRDINKDFAEGFRTYLMTRAVTRFGTPLRSSSQEVYWTLFKACINTAHRDGIIPNNNATKVGGIERKPRARAYLTIDELQRMAALPYEHSVFRRAFLFSCLTGLRKSDIKKLQWGEVHQQGEFTRIIFRQQKTGGLEYIDINPQAVSVMGRRGKPDELVFQDLRVEGSALLQLGTWAKQAGVDKHITFHSARHTFAVMMLDLGADIYTVSKLLGHSSIKTTQIYAKILDKKKQAAAMLIPPIFKKG